MLFTAWKAMKDNRTMVARDLPGYAWCETTLEVVDRTCHWSCEGCTTVCPGRHLALMVTDKPATT